MTQPSTADETLLRLFVPMIPHARNAEAIAAETTNTTLSVCVLVVVGKNFCSGMAFYHLFVDVASWTQRWNSPMWCSEGTSTPPCAYARDDIAGWHRSHASKSCSFTRWNSSTDRETSLPVATTSWA